MTKKKKQLNGVEMAIYKDRERGIVVEVDIRNETIWLTQVQIAGLFDTERSVITKHLKNIFQSDELAEKSNVQKMHIAHSDKPVKLYALDVIISVGYRVNSKQATQFRIWATKTLKHHLIQGYTINKKRIGKNYVQFMDAVESMRALLPAGSAVDTGSVLELIKMFAGTWVSLDAYDKDSLPTSGVSKKQVVFAAEELVGALAELKKDLRTRKEATEIFGQERERGSVAGIVGNVFQSVFGRDAYQSPEEKAAHLLYFMVKNHPYVDGNKRSGAFAFVWFLRKARMLRTSMTPEALTALTLLVAESKPSDKDKMVGLTVLLLNGK